MNVLGKQRGSGSVIDRGALRAKPRSRNREFFLISFSEEFRQRYLAPWNWPLQNRATARVLSVAKLNRQSSRSPLVWVSRLLVGATLLLSLLASSFPLGTLASGPMCTLACCAGRAPHAAGSCMNGSCHAFLTGHPNKGHIHHERPSRLLKN